MYTIVYQQPKGEIMTITTPSATGDPIDVWLKLDPDSDATHEANTYMTDTGYVIEWYLNSVGLVKAVEFDTLADAYDWYEKEGFEDFSS